MEALTAFDFSQKVVCDYISKDEEGPAVSDRTFLEIKKRNPEVSSVYNKGIEHLEKLAVTRLIEHVNDKVNAAVSLKATELILRAKCNWSTIPVEDKTSSQDDKCNLNVFERGYNAGN